MIIRINKERLSKFLQKFEKFEKSFSKQVEGLFALITSLVKMSTGIPGLGDGRMVGRCHLVL